jgi:hypothetical protein
MNLALIAAAASLLAPGRVVLPVDDFTIQNDPDVGGGAITTVLPDGRALFFRRGELVTLGRTGAVESRAPLAVPRGTNPYGLVRGPDGRVLVVLQAPARNKFESHQLQVMDAAAGAVGAPGIQLGCGACDVAAVAPDGSVFVAGTTGRYDPAIGRDPNADNNRRWVVAKLTPQLALDASFGDGGVVTLPVESVSGFAVALLGDGRIATLAQAGTLSDFRLYLARLTPSGALDRSFNGGAPLRTEYASGFAWLVHPDGTIDLQGDRPSAVFTPEPGEQLPPPRDLLARFAPDGTQTSVTDLGEIDVLRLLPEHGGKVLAVGSTTSIATVPGEGTFAAVRPGESIRLAELPFGGGIGGSLQANSHSFYDVLRRPDGSFLIPGGVGVARYTGEGEGLSVGGFAFSSLTPDLELESGFGGVPTPPRLTVSVPRQRASRREVRVRVHASTPGLVELRLRVSGHTIGRRVLPALSTKPFRASVPVRRGLRAALRRGAKVTVRARMRDLVRSTASASAWGRLR